jgi:hypothetical protein
MIPALLGTSYVFFPLQSFPFSKYIRAVFISVLCVEEIESRGLEEIGIYRAQAEDKEVHALKVDNFLCKIMI